MKVNFIVQTKKNEYFHAKIPQKKNFILLILDGVLRVIFDSTYLENRPPLGFQNFEIEIDSFLVAKQLYEPLMSVCLSLCLSVCLSLCLSEGLHFLK